MTDYKLTKPIFKFSPTPDITLALEYTHLYFISDCRYLLNSGKFNLNHFLKLFNLTEKEEMREKSFDEYKLLYYIYYSQKGEEVNVDDLVYYSFVMQVGEDRELFKRLQYTVSNYNQETLYHLFLYLDSIYDSRIKLIREDKPFITQVTSQQPTVNAINETPVENTKQINEWDYEEKEDYIKDYINSATNPSDLEDKFEELLKKYDDDFELKFVANNYYDVKKRELNRDYKSDFKDENSKHDLDSFIDSFVETEEKKTKNIADIFNFERPSSIFSNSISGIGNTNDEDEVIDEVEEEEEDMLADLMG